ncbi:MAG: hypothetical protein LBD06_10685 [Candidatus Accumulibacter sp.]|nr:hypothetical protein [Accumulibacter sp.]
MRGQKTDRLAAPVGAGIGTKNRAMGLSVFYLLKLSSDVRASCPYDPQKQRTKNRSLGFSSPSGVKYFRGQFQRTVSEDSFRGQFQRTVSEDRG